MKDYARKNTYRAKENERNNQGNHDRWLIAFIIITLCLAGLSALRSVYHTWAAEKKQVADNAQIQPPAKTPIEKKFRKAAPTQHEIHEKLKQTVKTVAKDEPPADNEPKYDFYQLLPKMTVDVPKPDDQKPI